MQPVIRSPSAFVPLTMSVLALCLVLGYVAMFGVTSDAPHDERAPARVFQLLLVGQLPIMASFAANWLPKKPRAAATVLALQALAMIATFGLAFSLER